MKLNFSEFDLYPITGSELACSSGRVVTSTDTNKNAKCKIVTLKIKNEHYCMIFIDALYIGSNLKEEIKKIINQRNKKLLFVSATHSHSLPNISYEYSYFGEVNNDYYSNLLSGISNHFEKDSLVYETVNEIHAENIISQNVSFRRKKINRPFLDVSRQLSSNKRFKKKIRFLTKGVIMYPSESHSANTLGVALRIKTNQKKYKFYSLFVHPTNIKTSTSRDIYENLESECHEEGFDFVGNHGFGADLKLFSKDNIQKNLKSKLRQIFFGKSYPEIKERDVTNILSNSSIRPFKNSKLYNPENKVKNFDISSDIGIYLNGLPIIYRFVAFSIGKLIFIFANCEVSSLYYDEFKKSLPYDYFIFPISCTDECVGYFPHYSYVGEGGYEDKKFIKYFGFTGNISQKKLFNFSQEIKSKLKGFL